MAASTNTVIRSLFAILLLFFSDTIKDSFTDDLRMRGRRVEAMKTVAGHLQLFVHTTGARTGHVGEDSEPWIITCTPLTTPNPGTLHHAIHSARFIGGKVSFFSVSDYFYLNFTYKR